MDSFIRAGLNLCYGSCTKPTKFNNTRTFMILQICCHNGTPPKYTHNKYSDSTVWSFTAVILCYNVLLAKCKTTHRQGRRRPVRLRAICSTEEGRAARRGPGSKRGRTRDRYTAAPGWPYASLKHRKWRQNGKIKRPIHCIAWVTLWQSIKQES